MNNRRNNKPGKAGRGDKLRIDTFLSSFEENPCPFHLTVFQDSYDCYINSKKCHLFREIHPQGKHLRKVLKYSQF